MASVASQVLQEARHPEMPVSQLNSAKASHSPHTDQTQLEERGLAKLAASDRQTYSIMQRP